MGYVFAAPPQVVLPVVGTNDVFPVHRIYCVGRNYADHAREMGHSGREAPFFFAKPADAVACAPAGTTLRLPYPARTADLQHEVELVVAVGAAGEALAPDGAAALVWGYGVGIDLTRRDLQSQAKQQGRPWDTAKGFDRSAPVGPLRPAHLCPDLAGSRIWLDVNARRRQDGRIADMIWAVPEILAHLSNYFRLQPGDLVFTGTPAGVAAVGPGDILFAGIDGVGNLRVEVTA